ncbi:MAG TPA: lysophospholipid acyltransferase family protein [bacterium]|nr:lysophospholipid acyltransferase family protein [bacterium]
MASPLQKIKNDLIYYSARCLMFFIIHTPNSLVAPFGRLFGTLVYNLAGGERRKTIESIRTAFPKGFDDAQVGRLAQKVWSNLGRNLFEVVHWMGWSRERIVAQVARVRGLEHMDKAMASGRGLFVVTGHLGNWELLGGYLGTKYKGSALAQKLYDPRFDELVNHFRREKLGATSMIKRGVALRGILEALKEKRFLLALVDQDTGQDGVFVSFFGKPAWTQSGVARIARKTGAAIIPAFVVRGTDGQYELHMDREIMVPRTKDAEKDVLETVRGYTEAVESYVKAYPDQWMWMHQRWKTRPPGEAT